VLAFVLVASWMIPYAAPAEPEYAIVASPDVAVSDLSLDELRRLFRFRRKFWKPSSPVTILLSEDNMQPGSFVLERIYQLPDLASLRRLILEKLYQGQINLAPKIVGSDELAVRFVAAGRGLLAVVRADALNGAGVKILTLDGKLPGSPGYAGRRSAGGHESP